VRSGERELDNEIADAPGGARHEHAAAAIHPWRARGRGDGHGKVAARRTSPSRAARRGHASGPRPAAQAPGRKPTTRAPARGPEPSRRRARRRPDPNPGATAGYGQPDLAAIERQGATAATASPRSNGLGHGLMTSRPAPGSTTTARLALMHSSVVWWWISRAASSHRQQKPRKDILPHLARNPLEDNLNPHGAS
jgi:hypothetical protein